MFSCFVSVCDIAALSGKDELERYDAASRDIEQRNERERIEGADEVGEELTDLVAAEWESLGAMEEVIDEGDSEELQRLEDIAAELAFIEVVLPTSLINAGLYSL